MAVILWLPWIMKMRNAHHRAQVGLFFTFNVLFEIKFRYVEVVAQCTHSDSFSIAQHTIPMARSFTLLVYTPATSNPFIVK